MSTEGPRDPLAGPDIGPKAPFPVKLWGPVIRGFGRGSKEVSYKPVPALKPIETWNNKGSRVNKITVLRRSTFDCEQKLITWYNAGFGSETKDDVTDNLDQLGIPTANIPPEGLSACPDIQTGVYYGFVGLSASDNPNSQTEATYPAVLSIGYNPFYKNTVRSVEIHILHSFKHDFYGVSLNLLMLGFIRPELDYVSKEKLIEDIQTDCEVALNSLKRKAYQSYEHDAWLKDFRWAADIDVTQVEEDVLGSAGP